MVRCVDCQHRVEFDNFPGFCVGHFCEMMDDHVNLYIYDERECENFLKIEKKKGFCEKLKYFIKGR